MSSEISGGTFEWTRPPDWPTQIRQLRLGQSGGLVQSNVPPEISLDISLLTNAKKCQYALFSVNKSKQIVKNASISKEMLT